MPGAIDVQAASVAANIGIATILRMIHYLHNEHRGDECKMRAAVRG
jgi:hypothetical protein